ncbi:MAG: secretin N-terminal domain-containing protein [Planctomycetaceae bacterium]
MRNSRAQRAVRHISCVALLTWSSLGHWAWAQAPAAPPAGGPTPTPGAAGAPGAETPAAGPVVRPETPDAPPNPEELKLRPDEQGRIRFNFQGQPWVSVVTWLAEISDLSLDWQELPPGFLNLHTQQSYSIEEARDLINRHLLDRGFTLLKHGEILSVVRITKVDPSLVPRLEPDELAEARPHDFVRVTFPLDWITAESAVEDLKALISPNGKLTTIKAANQLEAMDAVANLRDIRRLVADPESPRGPRRLVRQFRLEHIKATECQPQLQKLLGLERQSSSSGSDPATMFQQMATFMKQAGIQPGDVKVGRPQPPQVHIVANPRDNSIVVNAPAEQMAIITEAIKVLDVPQDPSRSVLRNGSRVQTFPLKTLQPDSAIKLLQELADLDPDTRLQADTKTRAIIAHDNLADQLTIRTLLEKLDGETRAFRVLPLKKLNAESVAFSLTLVLGGG